MLLSRYFYIRVALATMKRSSLALLALGTLAACGEEPPPHTVADFLEDPILLEATMVRCGQDRSASRYEVECINAQDAVDSIAKAEEDARRQQLEVESERKRQTLRRAQEAAAQARRRVQEEQRKREEAAYYGEFEPLPPEDNPPESSEPTEPLEGSEGDPPLDAPQGASALADERPQVDPQPAVPASDEPATSVPADPEAAGTDDLEAVREELRRREEEAQN
jgi:hypothetical protein